MGKSWIGLDLRRDGWCMVEVCKGAGTPVIKEYQYGAWPSTDAGEQQRIIGDLVTGRVRDGKRVTVSLPLEAGDWRHLSLPALPGSMLREAILNSLEETGRDQPFLGFKECASSRQGKEIEAFLYDRSILQERVGLLSAAGLKDVYFSPRSCGIINCLNRLERYAVQSGAFGGGHSLPSHSRGNYAYIEVSDTETEIGIFNKDRIVFLRSLPNPLKPEQEYNLDALGGELKIVQLLLRRENEDALLRCYLLGSATGLDYPDLRRTVAACFGLEERQVGYPPLYGFLQGLGEKGISTTGAVAATGLALEGMGAATGYGIRFNPDESIVQRRRFLYSGLIAAVGLCFIVGGVLFQMGLAAKKAKVEAVWQQEKTSLLVKANFYADLQKKRLAPLWFLREWTSIAPEGTVLNSLVIDGSEVKEVSGYTPVFGELYQRLLASPFLKGLKVRGGITTGTHNSEAFYLAGPLGEVNLEEAAKTLSEAGQ
ncbi:MAG TPA: hypothetical protein GXZ36_08340 [Firmicutes bacterium]|nr:hypothetical protein [Bacillota bacterium]